MRRCCFSGFPQKSAGSSPFLASFCKVSSQKPKAPNSSSGNLAWKQGRPRVGWVSPGRAAYLLFRKRRVLAGGLPVIQGRHIGLKFFGFYEVFDFGKITAGFDGRHWCGGFGLVQASLPFPGRSHLPAGLLRARGLRCFFGGVPAAPAATVG